jgi:hypothetical protein
LLDQKKPIILFEMENFNGRNPLRRKRICLFPKHACKEKEFQEITESRKR